MKPLLYVLLAVAMIGCAEKKPPCQVCKVLKNGEMIEQYDSCDAQGIKTIKAICEEMAQLQQGKCICEKQAN